MLSVIAVNHNSSALLKECLSSVASTLEDEPFEFLAVDSGSREEDAEALRSIEGGNVRLILSRENIGYARGVNAGIREARGDTILITNPDVVYKHGSINNMTTALSTLPRCGAVGPKTWWNKGMTFLLPMSELITPRSILRTELMKTSQTLNDTILRSWARKTSAYWLSEEPVMQEMLSGACIMTTRKVIENVGGFDDSFSLYFEDTDWCLRVRKAGYRLYMMPGSNIVHYYNQSAKQDTGASQEKFSASMDRYMDKHFRRYLPLLHAALKLTERRRFPSVYEDMGPLAAPPHFTFRDDSRKLFLLSPLDSLIPSAGSFLKETASFSIPEDLWELLGEGRYFAKAFKLHGFEDCGSWSWVKSPH